MSGPMILDCPGAWDFHRNPRSDNHDPECYRPATPEERLAGLKPEDGNLEAAEHELQRFVEGESEDSTYMEAMITAVAAWLGVSDG